MVDSPFKLTSPFGPAGDQPEAIKNLVKSFQEKKNRQTLLGVTGSGKTFTMANVIQQLGKKTLILAPNKTLAAQLYSEFREFFPDNAVEYFVSYYDYYRPEAYLPSSDTYIEKDSSVNDEIDKLRHSATCHLLTREDVIVIASVSCIYGIGSPDEYDEQKITLFQGDTVERDTLLKNLVRIQYARNDIDFSRGKFRVRGDVIEVFPAHEEAQIIRLEFFDDELTDILYVNPLTGKIIRSSNKITIFPSSHYVVGDKLMKRALKTISKELKNQLAILENEKKLVERQRLEQRTRLDLEMMKEMGFCSGIENYSRHLTGRTAGEAPPTLLDFFKKDFLLIVDESHMAIPQVGGMYHGDYSRKKTLVEHGFRLPSALDNRPLKFDEFETKLDQVLFVSATPANYELKESAGEIVEQIIRPTGLTDPVIVTKEAKHQVDDLLEEVKKQVEQKQRVLITTLTKKLAEDLTTYYQSMGIKIRYLHSDISTIERMEIINDLRMGEFDVLVGINLLREGLDIPEVSLVAILDADKEGFLRSTRSLIQTIGRAARNVDGRVILYAQDETRSMKEAIKETNRRRAKQEEFNKTHNITPKSIQKKISGGILDILQKNKELTKMEKNKKDDRPLTAEDLSKKINQLREKMKRASKELRFEEAAKYRDQIKDLNEAFLLLR